MRVKLKRKWLGTPPGQVVNVPENMGLRLLRQGTAVPCEKEEKAVKRPPKDKAIKSSADK